MYNENEEVTYDYEEEKESPWKKVLLIILAVVAVIIIILLLLKACTGNEQAVDNKEDILIEAAKEYYKKYDDQLPGTTEDCTKVVLETLLNENLISKPALFDDCSKQLTFVTGCYDGVDYNYTATLRCGDKVKYYYPHDNTDVAEVKEHYLNVPDALYNLKDDGVEGYKWYTESGDRTYFSRYVSESPQGYPNRGNEGTSVTTVTAEEPTEEEYRTITSNVTIYSTRTKTTPTTCSTPVVSVVGTPTTTTVNATKKWELCAYNAVGCFGNEIQRVELPNTCATQPSLTYHCRDIYTCTGTDEVATGSTCTNYTCATGKLNSDNTKCIVETCEPVYSAWSSWSTNKCTGSSDVCKSTTGYVYTDRVWQWYREAGRYYYPSGSTTAEGENIYYVDIPTEGAIKDETTKATVFKFYKLAY